MTKNRRIDRPFEFHTCYCRSENRDKFYAKWTAKGWEFLYEDDDCGGVYKRMRFRKEKSERKD